LALFSFTELNQQLLANNLQLEREDGIDDIEADSEHFFY